MTTITKLFSVDDLQAITRDLAKYFNECAKLERQLADATRDASLLAEAVLKSPQADNGNQEDYRFWPLKQSEVFKVAKLYSNKHRVVVKDE